MTRRLMSWLFGTSDRERAVTERLRQAEQQENEARERNTKTAIGSTLMADDTAEAMLDLLDRMERRRPERARAY
jgi:hypothetical protein